MIKQLSFNAFQTAHAILLSKYNYMLSGRGAGKSSFFGYVLHKIGDELPGASGVIAAKTYTHVLTSILPSAFAHLERMGYIRDVHYVIGKPPPKKWGNLPYNAPIRNFNNYITFYNPKRLTGFYLVSQERIGAGRGPNTDFLLTDETLRLDKERLDNELSPTLRANKDKFKTIPYHLGEFHSTSMPITSATRWILEKGNYYLHDYGIDYFGIWRDVVNMQLQLLEIEDAEEFKLQWNAIQRVRRKMKPLISKDKQTLFTLSNAFDNIENVGFSYIKEQAKRLPYTVFLIEIMNMPLTLNDSPFYNIDENKHFYTDGFDDTIVENIAISNKFNFNELKNKSAAILSNKYYNTNNSILLFFDWGGSGSFCLAAQFSKQTNTLKVIKEFYAMPGVEMTNVLMSNLCDFFDSHKNKKIIFLKDRYGDNRTAQSKSTINQDAVKILKTRGWKVFVKTHKHKEPPVFLKWELMQKIFAEKSKDILKIRIDAINCKYLTISLSEAKVKQVDRTLVKNKASERNIKIDQRTTTHFSDALDKGCWFLSKEKKSDVFIDINL